MSIPKPEHPRPQFVRPEWLCLNGWWQFETDAGDSGYERGLVDRELSGRILVPFCPESELSGVHERDFMPAVWYRRRVEIPAAWSGRRVLLHFQAVDYDTTVWVDGVEAGRHRGGFTPFSVALPARAGDHVTIVVRARDDHRQAQPRGKQSRRYANHACFYTRTTGIWQTVWLEPVPDVALARPRITPDVANGRLHLVQRLDTAQWSGRGDGLVVRATLRDGDGSVTAAECHVSYDLASHLSLGIPRRRLRLWSPADPHLYELDIALMQGDQVVDRAISYAGQRRLSLDDRAFRLNDEVLFQRLALDQGYYPGGIMTAPSDEALQRDIELSLSAGFNGARLHQKLFEERYLYHADRLGFIVWGEFPDWGSSGIGPFDDCSPPGPTYITQWLEALERDYSHPCIVGWCPMNETGSLPESRSDVVDDVARGMFLAARAMDATRPVLDASGFSHRIPETDVYDCHDYEQDPEEFAAHHAGLADGRTFVHPVDGRASTPYRGQPFFVSEFGGTWWRSGLQPGGEGGNVGTDESWGYGSHPQSIEQFYARFHGLCSVLLDNPRVFGYCYTQLTDVFQETNGIFTFDRRPKFDLTRLRATQSRPAAVEIRRSG